MKKALLINPPIYDVQYWERWSLPHGLLRVASFLEKNGYAVKLIDALQGDDHRRVKRKHMCLVEMGTGHEFPLSEFKGKLLYDRRIKSCFGTSLSDLEKQFQRVWNERMFEFGVPDEIWITSIMSYWWESTRDLISLSIKHFPDAKLRIGGVYPTLAPQHAIENLGLRAPLLIPGENFDLNNEKQLQRDLVVVGEIPAANDEWLNLDLYIENGGRFPKYTILTTSRGCPRDCEYCAAYVLSGKKVRTRSVDSVMDEIRDRYDRGIREFCFYEDNLLMAKKTVITLFDRIASDNKLKGIELFTPEGLEIRLVDQELAYLMRKAGFKRIYLPLESVDYENIGRFGRNFYSVEHFEKAVKCFERAGFCEPQQINVFVLFGLPGEDLQSVYDTAVYAANRTGSVIPMLFAPVPGTPLFTKLSGYIEEMGFEFHQLNGKLLPFLEYNRRAMKHKYDLRYMDYRKVEAFMFRLNQKLMRSTYRVGSDSRVGRAFRRAILSRAGLGKKPRKRSASTPRLKASDIITEFHGSSR